VDTPEGGIVALKKKVFCVDTNHHADLEEEEEVARLFRREVPASRPLTTVTTPPKTAF
jgi:hypothetical protein